MADEKKVRKLITAALKQSAGKVALVDLRKAIIGDDLLLQSCSTKGERKSTFAHSLDNLLEKKRVRLRGDSVLIVEEASGNDSKKRKRKDNDDAAFDEYEKE